MKLASFEVDGDVGPVRRLGVLDGEGTVADVTAGYAAVLAEDGTASPAKLAETIAPPAMIPFLERGDRAMNAAREARRFAVETDLTL